MQVRNFRLFKELGDFTGDAFVLDADADESSLTYYTLLLGTCRCDFEELRRVLRQQQLLVIGEVSGPTEIEFPVLSLGQFGLLYTEYDVRFGCTERSRKDGFVDEFQFCVAALNSPDEV